MKVGDLIELASSKRKNGHYAGKIGLIVDADKWSGYVINIGDEVRKFHTTQIARIINEGR